jgi:hypothetical protein
MKREHFVKAVEETLDALPQEFRSRIQNVAVLVEDLPPNQPSSQTGKQRRLLLGIFHGVPTTNKSVFDLPSGPDHIVLYQKNIEWPRRKPNYEVPRAVHPTRLAATNGKLRGVERCRAVVEATLNGDLGTVIATSKYQAWAVALHFKFQSPIMNQNFAKFLGAGRP